MIDAKDALPQGFTPVDKTIDTGKETGSPSFSLGFFGGLVFVSLFFFNSASSSGRGPPRQLCWR